MEGITDLLPKKCSHTIQFQRLVKKKGGSYTRTPFHHRDIQGGKYITLSMFMANLTNVNEIGHIYLMGCLQNVIMKDLVYKDWGMIIYVDASSWHVYPELHEKYFLPILQHYPDVYVVEVDFRTQLPLDVSGKLIDRFGKRIKKHENKYGWDLALVASEADITGNLNIQYVKTIWRFLPGGYNTVFISRDADARINIREEIAMREWIHSTYTFSRMFDNMGHSNPFLAGMWGAKSACHNILNDYSTYGSCKRGDVPIPNIEAELLTFLGDSQLLSRGYGIDELFLGQLDDRLSKDYYDNVLTFGKGGYYAGSVVFSLFTDRQSLKVGHRMLTLMPAGSPDDIKGSNVDIAKYTLDKEHVPLLGRNCYFVGEDLPIKKNVSPEIINWLIHWSLHYKKAQHTDFNIKELTEQCTRFRMKLDVRTFAHDITHMTCANFQQTYSFDKRVLPHFWYVFLSGTSANIPFFEIYGVFNPNDREVHIFEAANRRAFLNHPELTQILLSDANTAQFKKLEKPMLRYLTNGKGTVTYRGVNLTPFFKDVRQEVLQHSHVIPLLSHSELDSYWNELLIVYPFTALRTLGQEF